MLCLWTGLFCLTGCDAGGKDEAGKPKAASVQAQLGTAATEAAPPPREPEEADEPPATAEELEQADKTVAFANAASRALAAGRYGLPDAMAGHVRRYLREWELAPRPDSDNERDKTLTRALTPPEGLFTGEETEALARQVETMDKAVGSMRADYRALEKYVNDHTIRDDGVRGKNLAASLEQAHEAFTAARRAYLDFVDARAEAAADILLRGHPLKRQIQASEKIFVFFKATAECLREEKPDREGLASISRELNAALKTVERPPFRAAPHVERAFRHFVRQARGFALGLERGLDSGFYAPVRRDLNSAAQASREAYNAFVHEANQP